MLRQSQGCTCKHSDCFLAAPGVFAGTAAVRYDVAGEAIACETWETILKM